MDISELAWAMLPEGLKEYFDLESFEKDENIFKIVLLEKNILPKEMPVEYHGKKVINTVLNDFTMDDFNIRGRKTELILRRRWWKFEGVPNKKSFKLFSGWGYQLQLKVLMPN